jgi:hypothetical protein
MTRIVASSSNRPGGMTGGMKGPRMRRRASSAIAALTVSSGALLIGSPVVAGAASSNAKQIVVSAIADSKSANSVQVVGNVITASQTINLNVRASNANQGEGTITINGAMVEIVRVGSSVYFNGDAAFWTQSAGAAASSYAGQWVSTPANGSDGKSFSEFLGTAALFRQIFSGYEVSQSTFTKGLNTSVVGVPVFSITGTNMKDGTTGIIDIARTGEPYVIELTKTDKTGSSRLVFSAYNKPVHAKAPPHSVTVTQLEQRAAASSTAST